MAHHKIVVASNETKENSLKGIKLNAFNEILLPQHNKIQSNK